MTQILTTYQKEFRTKSTHLDSKQELITDAPKDNNGKGNHFSPTDLFATALTTCIFTVAGQAAENRGFSIDGATAVTTKKMSLISPRKIAEINIEFNFSKSNLDEKQQLIVKHAAEICPVSLSINPEIIKNIKFIF